MLRTPTMFKAYQIIGYLWHFVWPLLVDWPQGQRAPGLGVCWVGSEGRTGPRPSSSVSAGLFPQVGCSEAPGSSASETRVLHRNLEHCESP